jgi:hypothetical protein
MLIAGLISYAGCATLRKNADWRDPDPVNRIVVTALRGSHFENVKTIDSPDKTGEVVAYVNRFRQGWTPVWTTAPSGKLYIAFAESDDAHKQPLFYLRVCPRETGGEILTDIDGKTCGRDVSETELDQLLALLDLNRDVFEGAAQ